MGLNAYHDLSVAIRESSCCIAANWVLAVSEPAPESILHLGRREEGRLLLQPGLGGTGGRRFDAMSYLSAQDAVHHDDDKTLQRVKDGEENLKKDGALVGHGEHRRHPGESQQRQDHTGAPERRPETGGREARKRTVDCV